MSLRTEFTRYKCLDYRWENDSLVQEQPVLGILYHPAQALVEILACHSAAGENNPFMCLDHVQLKALTSIDS